MMNRSDIASEILKDCPYFTQGQAYRTPCTSAVLNFFGIENFRFCQYVSDMVRHFNRHGFSCRRVAPIVARRAMYASRIAKVGLPCGFYLVQVSGHALLARIENPGDVSFPVDTYPAARDYQRIVSLHKIGRLAKKRIP